MEIFRDTHFDFLGKKWWAVGASAALLAVGLASIIAKGGISYGIDFKGGALMTVKWAGQPPVERIRAAVGSRIPGEVTVYELGDLTQRDQVGIGTELTEERQLNENRRLMQETLERTFGQPQSGKLDFNNASQQQVLDRLREPLQRAGVALSEQDVQKLVARVVDFRNEPPRSGLIENFDQLRAVEGVTPAILNVFKEQFYLAPFAVQQVEMVGPKVGAELRRRAILATLYALAGMLVYIAFRFEWIYGVGAVIAVFHDAIITIGLMSVFGYDISLTVVAALLTLVGYSVNDTIVIFDRIRENLRISRREPLVQLMNRSINETLSRTIMTSALTFLTVVALYLFGGPVLRPFAFTLVVGFIIGTYSTVYIASAIVLAWNNWSDRRKRPAPVIQPSGRPPAVVTTRKGQTRLVK